MDMWILTSGSWGAGSFSVGDSSSTARFVTAATSLSTGALVTRLTAPGGAGYLVSLTASDINSFDTIDVTFAGAITSTLTGSLQMAVYYTMDPNAGV